MRNFKVGDRVVCIKEDYVATPGEKGTIRVIEHHGDDHDFGVELDNNLGGNDLSMNDVGFKCEDGHGWWAAAKNIRLLENRFEVGQIYRVGKLSSQHQYENAIVKLVGNRSFWFTVKAIRGEAPNDFGKCSEYARALTLLTGPQIGEAIRKWDEEHAKKSGVREVKRHAKAGEYIKIIFEPDCHIISEREPFITVGNAYQVERESFFAGDVRVKDSRGQLAYIDSREYVVLEGYKPEQKGGIQINGKHSYTAEQIERAKKLCGEMMVEALDDGNTFAFHFYDKFNGGYKGDCAENECKFETCAFDGTEKRGIATCSDHDEYNVWIGRCVALCKALHKPIPAFITEG